VYLEYAYPRPRFLASSLVAVQAVLLGFTASNCIIFSKYTLFALSAEPTELQHKVLAVGLLTVITIIHGCFLKTGIFVQNVLGWVKIFLIGAMSLTGIWVVFLHFNGDTGDLSPGSNVGSFSWDSIWEGSNWSWSLLSTALFKVYYSYAGLSNINNVLNEVHDPVGIVKTVCPTALFTAGSLYFLANLSYFLVIPLEEIKNSGELVGALLFERLFGDQIGRIFFPLAIAISAAGNVMVVTFALVCQSLIVSFHILIFIGTSESGNSPTRVPPVAKCPFFYQAIWNSSWRTYRALYSFCSCHRSAAPRRCLQLHSGSRGIPGPGSCFGGYCRPSGSSLPRASSPTTLQSMAACSLATRCGMSHFASNTIHPTAKLARRCRFLLCYVCPCRYWNVSI
jgi:hypothetical protein